LGFGSSSREKLGGLCGERPCVHLLPEGMFGAAPQRGVRGEKGAEGLPRYQLAK